MDLNRSNPHIPFSKISRHPESTEHPSLPAVMQANLTFESSRDAADIIGLDGERDREQGRCNSQSFSSSSLIGTRHIRQDLMDTMRSNSSSSRVEVEQHVQERPDCRVAHA